MSWNLVAVSSLTICSIFFLSFAAKQPLVYLNLEFGDKYNDVVLALWELGTIFVFDPFFLNKVSPRSSEFHWKHTMIAEIVC